MDSFCFCLSNTICPSISSTRSLSGTSNQGHLQPSVLATEHYTDYTSHSALLHQGHKTWKQLESIHLKRNVSHGSSINSCDPESHSIFPTTWLFNISLNSVSSSVFVFYCCYNKLLQTQWFKTTQIKGLASRVYKVNKKTKANFKIGKGLECTILYIRCT